MAAPTMTPGIPEWAEALAGRLINDHVLAPLTTLKIGGPADWYFPAHTPDELAEALECARQGGIPMTFLGDGSNVLISDLGIRGLVVHNRAQEIERRGNNLYAQSGALLCDLVDRSRAEALTGLEFAAGIYGSVGGAVFGNAGAYGKAMADILLTATVLTRDGAQMTVEAPDLEFTYRRSACRDKGWIVLDSEFGFQPGDTEAVGAEIDRIIAVRATKLPTDLPSAGSYFKNIEDPTAEHGKVPAGRLLEAVGAKSMRVGGAGVFAKHANVIVNLGGATAADVLALATKMRNAVYAEYGVELHPEVRFLGEPIPVS
jgi:UDP-N-acetylmuramate dehydrogenase